MAEVAVIGCGLPRTGTRSLADALSILGYQTLHQPADHWNFGLREYETQLRPDDFRNATPPCEAFVEPKYWRLTLTAWPAARVILTVREPESWWKSMVTHTHRYMAQRDTIDPAKVEAIQMVNWMFLGSAWPNKTMWIDHYFTHRLAVGQFCWKHGRPLLIFDCTAGEWGDLPGFVGRPMPDRQFPHRNATTNFKDTWTRRW